MTSAWRDRRNAQAKLRLAKALPATFPAPVLIHAYARALTPPLPRLAVESYWAAHPLRADRLARALARRSGAPPGWRWRLSTTPEDGLGRGFRTPPAPYRETAFSKGAGACCICGQTVFRFGWHRDLWGQGKPNLRATWHACCVAAWKFWNAPSDQVKLLRKRQGRGCPASGDRLLRTAEVDHRLPLYSVWRDHRERPWPDLLGFWGGPNLQIINALAHRRKSGTEAGERTGKTAGAGQDRVQRDEA